MSSGLVLAIPVTTMLPIGYSQTGHLTALLVTPDREVTSVT